MIDIPWNSPVFWLGLIVGTVIVVAISKIAEVILKRLNDAKKIDRNFRFELGKTYTLDGEPHIVTNYSVDQNSNGMKIQVTFVPMEDFERDNWVNE